MKNSYKFITLILILLIILCLFSILVIHYGINFENKHVADIILGIRIKQLCGAIAVGGSLAITGTVLQTYFNNSLASPHILGIISLSGVGAALSIVFGLSFVYQFGFALGGSLLFFILMSYSNIKHSNIIFIVIFLNFVGDSLIMWIKYLFARIEDYASIDYWFWGSLEKITSNTQWWLLALIIPVLTIIFKSSNFLDLISQGIEHQKNISFNTKIFIFHERLLIFMTSIIVAISTITTGKIGFIGLMAPHISKKNRSWLST